MVQIREIPFSVPHGEHIQIELSRDDPDTTRSQTTVVTGVNGSGKSSILNRISEAILIDYSDSNKIKLTNVADSRNIRLIACAGTGADRFPLKEIAGKPTKFDRPNYIYLGHRAGPNIISRKQPLETVICNAICRPEQKVTFESFDTLFNLIGLKPTIKAYFRRRIYKSGEGTPLRKRLQDIRSRSEVRPLGRSTSHEMANYLLDQFDADAFSNFENLSFDRLAAEISLGSAPAHAQPKLHEAVALGILSGELHLTDAIVESRRGKKDFSAFELSSGEYHMLTSILGVGLSTKEQSVVLIDEPENSLHPQWQIEFMRAIETISLSIDKCHFIISTHSPLIVSSAAIGSTIVDIDKIGASLMLEKNYYGMGTEEILTEHFGIASSRNFHVVEAVQDAIACIESGNIKSDKFLELSNKLRHIRSILPKSDPLHEIISAIIG